MKNSAADDQGGCFPQRPKAEVDNEKPNSIIALLFIQNNFKLLKEKMSSLFFCSPKIAQPRPQVLSLNGLLIYSGLHF